MHTVNQHYSHITIIKMNPNIDTLHSVRSEMSQIGRLKKHTLGRLKKDSLNKANSKALT